MLGVVSLETRVGSRPVKPLLLFPALFFIPPPPAKAKVSDPSALDPREQGSRESIIKHGYFFVSNVDPALCIMRPLEGNMQTLSGDL